MPAHSRSLATSFFLFLLVIGLAAAVVYQSYIFSPKAQAETPVVTMIPTNSPIPTKAPVPSRMQTVTSFKGDKKVEVFSHRSSEGNRISVQVSEMNGQQPVELFNKIVSVGEQISIPANAWSPDDAYLFLTRATGGRVYYYVYRTSGRAFTADMPYLDVTALWDARNSDLTLRDISGWASETLLILHTAKSDGTKGPLYWFEVPSKGFLLLSQ